jgi:hypothetical protein
MQEGSIFRGCVECQTWKQAGGSSALHVSFAHISPGKVSLVIVVGWLVWFFFLFFRMFVHLVYCDK